MKKKSTRGRKKNTIKAEAVAELTTEQKYHAARYGEKFDAAALKAISALRNSIYLGSTSKTLGKQIQVENQRAFLAYVVRNYRRAFRTNDYSFWGKLAEAMIYDQQPNHPQRTIVGSAIMAGGKLPTANEMDDTLKSSRAPADIKSVRRAFAFYGRKPTASKPGSKPGVPHKKPTHRASAN